MEKTKTYINRKGEKFAVSLFDDVPGNTLTIDADAKKLEIIIKEDYPNAAQRSTASHVFGDWMKEISSAKADGEASVASDPSSFIVEIKDDDKLSKSSAETVIRAWLAWLDTFIKIDEAKTAKRAGPGNGESEDDDPGPTDKSSKKSDDDKKSEDSKKESEEDKKSDDDKKPEGGKKSSSTPFVAEEKPYYALTPEERRERFRRKVKFNLGQDVLDRKREDADAS